jgi:hypothetical protein
LFSEIHGAGYFFPSPNPGTSCGGTPHPETEPKGTEQQEAARQKTWNSATGSSTAENLEQNAWNRKTRNSEKRNGTGRLDVISRSVFVI